MSSRAALSIALSIGAVACGRHSFDSIVDADGDAIDAAVAQCSPELRPCGCWTTKPSNFDPCNSCAPTLLAALMLSSPGMYNYDTDTGVLVDPLGTTVDHDDAIEPQLGTGVARVLYGAQLDVGPSSTLAVRGTLPLVLAIEGALTVDGTIDVSAGATEPGPGGGQSNQCGAGIGGDAKGNGGDIYGGSGGGGGAFGAGGGAGGDGWGVGASNNGGAPGLEEGDIGIVPLRGGCNGGRGRDGWTSTGNPIASVRGFGGGAVQLASCMTTSISGTVRASGSGGAGGRKNPATFVSGGGGAGGGAGGAILIESKMLQLTASARLCANGGSGGEGGSELVAGADGSAGSCSTSAAVTPDTIGEGGAGGAGGGGGVAAGSAGGTGQPQNGGGGGGGGAVGRIRLIGWASQSIDPAAVVAPPPQ